MLNIWLYVIGQILQTIFRKILYWSLLLSNIFINDLFFFSGKFESFYFGYGNSLYSSGMNLDKIFTNLTQDTWNVFEWLAYNSIGDITKISLWSVTLLGIIIDSKLNFKENIINIMKKVYHKLYTLRRLQKFQT